MSLSRLSAQLNLLEKKMFKNLLQITFLLSLPLICYSQNCPDITRLITTEGSRIDAPDGFYVFAIYDKKGLYFSKIREYSPVIIPGTRSDSPTDISISSNGKWVLYNSAGIPYLVRLSSSCKIKIPIKTDNAAHVCFWRNQPNGEDAICYMENFYTIRALTVQFDMDTVYFGNDRLILSFNDSLPIRPAMRLLISADHLFNPIFPQIGGTYPSWRSEYITLPQKGQGIATPKNVYTWAEPFSHTGGCGHAMSWDGTLCAGDFGTMSESSCLPRNHKGFTITPFWRDTDPPQTMESSISKAVSMNWCPERFRFGSSDDQNFWDWYFGNSNDYLIGNQLGALAEIHGIWLVRWKDNNWTLLTDPLVQIEAYQPAVHFCDMSTVHIDTISQIDTGNVSNDDPNDPQFKIIAPNGGETFYRGDTIQVRLYSRKPINSSLKFTLDGGLTWNLLVNTGIDPFIDTLVSVPLTYRRLKVDSTDTGDFNQCMVLIQDYGTGRYTDCSDSFFSIKYDRSKSREESGTGCGRGVSHALLLVIVTKLSTTLKRRVQTKNYLSP